MDVESLAQIERLVSGSDGHLRQEFGERTILVQRELAEKREELNRHNSAYAEELCRKLDILLGSQQGFHEDMDRLEATINRHCGKAQALARSMMGQSNPQSKAQSCTKSP